MSQAGPAAGRPRFGALVSDHGIRFAVWSGSARRIWVSIFDAEGRAETDRLELSPEDGGVFSRLVPGLRAGARYGFRADGAYDREQGLWFDPDKLLVDPYAVQLDRPFSFDAALCAPRGEGRDTAPLMPRAIAPDPWAALPASAPLFGPGGLIYELQVRAFSMRHPDVPAAQRGTIAALGHPAVIEHLRGLGVGAVELMPVTAWIDERHLPPLGLTNGWGYNPVVPMALDPRLAPGGLAELRQTVAALHSAGIGVLLDLVFNHTGESDALGPTLSLRGLDARAYYRHDPDGRLANDTGTGNTLACDHPVVQELVVDTLRHFVVNAGVDGFRFDLAPILGRTGAGFDADAPLLRRITTDAVLADRVLIAEPWDIGPGGYQLGNFPQQFMEWNDRYRDDVRRFWRGDLGTIGTLATRLAGSSDIFAADGGGRARGVNFIAAHDGMTLADTVAYERKHNEANGEQNRDGHNENLSWNNGVEGETDDAGVNAQRKRDVRALLATLFASRGAIMLTAGDEFGRTQRGNNNAYAQDNPVTWLDWEWRDHDREAMVMALSAIRRETPALTSTAFLTGEPDETGIPDVAWLAETGAPLTAAQWEEPQRRRLAMLLSRGTREGGRLAVLVNGDRRATTFALPAREGFVWEPLMQEAPAPASEAFRIAGRSVMFVREVAGGAIGDSDAG